SPERSPSSGRGDDVDRVPWSDQEARVLRRHRARRRPARGTGDRHQSTDRREVPVLGQRPDAEGRRTGQPWRPSAFHASLLTRTVLGPLQGDFRTAAGATAALYAAQYRRNASLKCPPVRWRSAAASFPPAPLAVSPELRTFWIVPLTMLRTSSSRP